MRIIKRVPWVFAFVCTGCKSELECEASDVKYGVSGMDAEGGYFCECAVCGQQKSFGWDAATSVADRRATPRPRSAASVSTAPRPSA